MNPKGCGYGSNISSFNPQDTSNTLLSLNRMGLSWNDIEVKKRGLGNKLLESL